MPDSARFTLLSPVRRMLLRSVVGAVLAGVLLSGCVTNEEQGNPEGWHEIVPAEVPEIAALVPEEIAAKGYLKMGTNPPFAPFEFKNSQGQIIGLEIDVTRALAGVLELELRTVEQDYSLILQAGYAGAVDFRGSAFTCTGV